MSNEIERVEGEVIPTPKSPEQAGRELGEALAKFNQAWVGVITGVKQGLGNPPIVVENELRKLQTFTGLSGPLHKRKVRHIRICV
jgi:hypothetical protein